MYTPPHIGQILLKIERRFESMKIPRGNYSPEREERFRRELSASRRRLREEMKKALKCKTSEEKRALVKRWKEENSEITVNEMLRCARDRRIASVIANWSDEEIEGNVRRKEK
jgi:hypothetical protein